MLVVNLFVVGAIVGVLLICCFVYYDWLVFGYWLLFTLFCFGLFTLLYFVRAVGGYWC